MRAAGIKRLKTLHSILHLGDHLKGRRAADAAPRLLLAVLRRAVLYLAVCRPLGGVVSVVEVLLKCVPWKDRNRKISNTNSLSFMIIPSFVLGAYR